MAEIKTKTIIYFDLSSGASGDMIIGSLLDLFDSDEIIDILNKEIAKLNIGLKYVVEKKIAGAILSTDVVVKVASHDKLENAENAHYHNRGFYDIKKIIDDSSLNSKIKDRSIKIFRRLGNAEAKIHGKKLEDIHFHEVGALDTIGDVVGAVILLEKLKIDRIVASPINLGTGEINCAHGKMSVPAPAPVEILRSVNASCYIKETDAEVFTPTAAAIIAEITDEFSFMPVMNLKSVGYGRGKNETKDGSKPLRVILGTINEENESKESSNSKVNYDSKSFTIEVNIDDMNPEHYEYLAELLYDSGAKDVSIFPIMMKKYRPGSKLSVICNEKDLQNLIDIIFKHSTTTGVRFYEVMRQTLEESFVIVEVRGEKIKVKQSMKNGIVLNKAPEYEDCKKVSRKTGLSLKEVYKLALERI